MPIWLNRVARPPSNSAPAPEPPRPAWMDVPLALRHKALAFIMGARAAGKLPTGDGVCGALFPAEAEADYPAAEAETWTVLCALWADDHVIRPVATPWGTPRGQTPWVLAPPEDRASRDLPPYDFPMLLPSE